MSETGSSPMMLDSFSMNSSHQISKPNHKQAAQISNPPYSQETSQSSHQISSNQQHGLQSKMIQQASTQMHQQQQHQASTQKELERSFRPAITSTQKELERSFRPAVTSTQKELERSFRPAITSSFQLPTMTSTFQPPTMAFTSSSSSLETSTARQKLEEFNEKLRVVNKEVSEKRIEAARMSVEQALVFNMDWMMQINRAEEIIKDERSSSSVLMQTSEMEMWFIHISTENN